MEGLLLLVPAVATAALGGALFVPIRDGRAGRKATFDGRTPLQADFRTIASANGTACYLEAESSENAVVPRPPYSGKAEASDTSATIVSQGTTAAAAVPECETSEETDECALLPIDDAAVTSASKDTAAAPAGEFDPIAFFRSVARRLRTKAADTIVEAKDAIPETVCERSFADELASLLPVVQDRAPATPATATVTTSAEFDFDRGPVRDTERSHDDVSVVASGIELPTSAPYDASANDDAANFDTHDVPATVVRAARVVPLTRLPLRHRATEITWPGLASPPQRFATIGERHAFLRARAADPQLVDDIALAQAFREETPEGRTLALAALRRSSASREAIETFAEALGTGSDDERALAIDALGEAGARDELARGVEDRIDAIAAKAALAYVGTTARDDYRVALSPLIDDTRIDTILALLAGVVE